MKHSSLLRRSSLVLGLSLACIVSCGPKIVWSSQEQGQTQLIVKIWNKEGQPSGLTPNLLPGVVREYANQNGLRFKRTGLGTFLYQGLKPGEYTIQITYNCLYDDLSKGMNQVSESFVISASENKQVEITLGCKAGVYID